MTKLIVSWRTYDWVKYTSGMIIQEPSKCQLLIVNADDDRLLVCFDRLCRNAIYEQRKHDVSTIGNYIGLPKATNLLYKKDSLDISKLIAHIHINILMSGIQEVYFQDNRILNPLFKQVQKENNRVKIYRYGVPNSEDLNIKPVFLSDKEFEKKLFLRNFMVGVGEETETEGFSRVEIFYGLRGEDEQNTEETSKCS